MLARHLKVLHLEVISVVYPNSPGKAVPVTWKGAGLKLLGTINHNETSVSRCFMRRIRGNSVQYDFEYSNLSREAMESIFRETVRGSQW